MTLFHWLLFIVSALLYGAPFHCSTYCWPFVLIFPAPLLYVAAQNTVSYKHGILWAIIAFGIHLGGVIAGLDNFAEGTLFARTAPGIVLVMTTAIYTATWFAINNLLVTQCSLKTTTAKLLLWTISYGFFILFMEHASFILYGRIEGHFLFNPLFVLAEYPQILSLLPLIGKSVLTMLIMGFSGSLVYWLLTKSRYSLLCILLFAAPWIISISIPLQPMQTPSWLSHIAYVPAKLSSDVNLTRQATAAQEIFFHVAVLNPDAKLIIMPESSIFCDHLSKAPELCALWSGKELLRPLHIVLGSFRWDGPAYRNTLHWFYDGKLQEIFDKRHAMLLTEALPEIFSFKLFEDLFFSKYPGITPSTNERKALNVLDEVAFIPYICSELFFNDTPDDTYGKGSTILAITNDLWCSKSNISKMMCLAARLRAIQWQRNILYISYAFGRYYDTAGNEIDLNKLLRN